MLLRASLVALALCCLAAGAQATPTPCAGPELMEVWKRGHAAFAAGDHALAYPLLQPLAENGFAPAQWLVGRMLTNGEGTTRDEAAGLMWLKLAGMGELKLARPFASALESRLDMTAYEAARRRAENWRAKWTQTCAGVARPDTRFAVDKSAGLDRDALVAWWRSMTQDALARRPEAAPYLLSVGRLLFVDSPQNAGVERLDGEPVLVISSRLRDLPLTEAAAMVLPAAREAVNEMALVAVGTAPRETYKGRTLRGHAAADSTQFLTLMRSALDLADKLPAPLRDKVALIREIRYEPNFTYGVSLYNEMGSVFVADKRLPGGGYLSFRHPPTHQSPANAVLALLAGASFAANPGQPDGNPMQCLIAADQFKAAEALAMGPRARQDISQTLKKRNCG